MLANGVDYSQKALVSTKGKAAVLQKFNDYFYFGGFPEGATLSIKRDYLTSVYQKIYLGDIAVRYSVENTFALRIMFKKLAESVKQPISFNRIASIVSATGTKIGTSTIINYIEYAKDAWLIIPVQNIADKLVDKETNKNIEFDFYVPETGTAIQVCYDLNNSPNTLDREVNALLKLANVLTCDELIIITRDTEDKLEKDGKTITVIPIWKWLLEFH